jgi:hypothetical protein
MNYLIAVLKKRIQAEDAYSALARAKLPIHQVEILGDGFKNADDFGLINPNQQALKQAKKLMTWLIPFGFGAGYLFNLLTQITIVSWGNDFVNYLIGGLFGAGAGALGALIVGVIIGWTVASGDAIAYRNRLNAGKYLIIVKGSDEIINQATKVLCQFELENIQGYRKPALG